MNKFQFNQEFTDNILAMTKVSDKGSEIIFSADGGKLTVITKGSEICVRRHFIVDPKVKIAFVMHMADFESVLNEFTYGVIEVKKDRIILTIADTSLERLTIPFTDVSEPEFPSDIKNETSITADVFEMAAHVAYAAATQNSTQPETERVAIMVKNNWLRAYALDGYRFATVESACSMQGDGQEYLLRPSLIAGLNTLIKKEKWDTVSIGSTDRRYLIKMGEFEICTNRLQSSGKYNIIENVLDKAQNNPHVLLTFSRGELVRYLQRISLVEDRNEWQSLVMLFDPDKKGVFTSYQSKTGRLGDIFDVDYEDMSDAISLAVKPEFLLSACQKVKDKALTMCITQSVEPILLRETCNGVSFIHCVLPVRFDTSKVKYPVKKTLTGSDPAANVPARPLVIHENIDPDVDDSALAS